MIVLILAMLPGKVSEAHKKWVIRACVEGLEGLGG